MLHLVTYAFHNARHSIKHYTKLPIIIHCLAARFQLRLVYPFLFASSSLIRFSLLFMNLAWTVDNQMFLLFHHNFHLLLLIV